MFCKRLTVIVLSVALSVLLPDGAMAAISAPEFGDLTVKSVDLQPAKETKTQKEADLWYDNLAIAISVAVRQYKPILLFFRSDNCAWSIKMRDEVMRTEEVQDAMKSFVKVQINVDKQKQLAMQYGVDSVPTIILMSSDKSENIRLPGFCDAETLAEMFNSTVGGSSSLDASLEALLEKVMENKADQDDFREIAIFFGKNRKLRRMIVETLDGIKTFPDKTLVGLLSDKRLTVRLGALELLEGKSGDTFGFDPWAPVTSPSNQQALGAWQKWAGKKNEDGPQVTVLSRERYFQLLKKLLSNNSEQSSRALFTLYNGGDASLMAIKEFLSANPGISSHAKMKIKEVRYAVILKDAKWPNPLSEAHRLVFGNQAAREQILQKLGGCMDAMPIVSNHLDSPQVVIRETAIDSMSRISKTLAAPLFIEQLKKEKDLDVIFCIIRNLGEIDTLISTKALEKFLDNENEDLVVAALQSLKEHSGYDVAKVIKCLNDSRWRIQVAAMDTLSKKRTNNKILLEQLRNPLLMLLDSKDDFVRIKAIEMGGSLKDKKIWEKLETLFLNNDEDKSAVAAVYVAANKDIPDKFVDALNGKDSQLLIEMAARISAAGDVPFKLAEFMCKSKNRDIYLCGLSAMAKAKTKWQRYYWLNAALKSGKREDIVAMLSCMKVDESLENISKQQNLKHPSRSDVDNKSQDMTELLDAFGSSDKPAKKQQDELGELVDAFGGENQKEPQKTALRSTPEEIIDFVLTLEDLLKNSEDEEIRFTCAMILLRVKRSGAAVAAAEMFSKLSSNKKEVLLHSVRPDKGVNNKALIKFLTTAIQDENDEVQKRAAILLIECGDLGIGMLLRKYAKSNGRIKIHNILVNANYYLSQLLKAQIVTKPWAYFTLNSKDSSVEHKIFAMTLLLGCQETKAMEYFQSFANSENSFLKRAALTGIGSINFGEFIKYSKELASAKEEHLRSLLTQIPAVYVTKDKYDRLFTIMIDEKHSYRIETDIRNMFLFKMDKDYIEILNRLTKDISPGIRISAGLLLLRTNNLKDINALTDELSKAADQDKVKKEITSFFVENIYQLDTRYKPLLAFFKEDEIWDNDKASMIVKLVSGKQLSVSEKKLQQLALRDSPAAVPGKSQVLPNDIKNTDNSVRLVYFYKNGCEDCKHVEQMLSSLTAVMPELKVEKYNIGKIDAMRLNESYCEKFKVPTVKRMVAPSIFTGAGALVRSEVNIDRLANLIQRSVEIPDEQWHLVKKSEIASAEKRITQRYSALSTLLIIAAGFLDGIGPCAFATIIFFISYMLITRRSKLEIVQVAGAFILAVFIAYYLIGIGLFEVIVKLEITRILGIWFTRLLTVGVAILFLLSVYDGIMCLRGRVEDIKLQLPNFIKRLIHVSIRKGSRHYNFVIAAFVIGIIISLLEFACTGQVYAPTILFMIKSGATAKLQAYLLLALYNLAFVLPLVVIFAFSYIGMSSRTMTAFFRKNVVFVKFGTALIFAVILLWLILGEDKLAGVFSLESENKIVSEAALTPDNS